MSGAVVLFGAGIGLGAWIARPSTEPARTAVSPGPSAVRSTTVAAAPQRPAPAVATPVAPAVPLPRLAAVAPAVPLPVTPAVPEGAAAAPRLQAPVDSREAPAWQRYAAAAEPAEGRPMIAIVLDDLGIDKRRGRRAIELPAPVTLAFLPYATELEEQTVLARQRGHELLVHVPMQPQDHNSDPGPNVLDVDLGVAELRGRIAWNLRQFDGYVGVNNHMGSRFTESEDGMRLVVEEMRDRGLLFLDSLTSGRSVGEREARAAGIPTTRRDVFLDNTDTAAEVELRLAQTERVARETGSAIAIGHPRDATLNVLEAWIPKARAAGFVIVPLTAVVAARAAAGLQQAKR
ncbi:divergent polysaccharide deacetylase family protein [Thalassobaculum sp.]|uniref:divergent polysaccharide deacetylase family protein n=1 Tax=Thalassobaculum sp. TaxID=2022740 RepID=UPI0032EF6C1B